MPAISSISIIIKAITAPFIKGIRAAATVMAKFTSTISSMATSIIKLTSIAIAGFTAALGALSIKAIMTAASFETLEKQFKVILGSASLAAKRMAELQEAAATTPFKLSEYAKASRILETLTKGALSMGAGLRLVGDAAAAADQPISELAIHIGRVFQGAMSGRAVGESLARLQELGIVSGEVRTEFELLQKSGQKGAHVWETIAKELSKTEGAMKELSSTTKGLYSTFSDNLDLLFGAVGSLLEPFVKVALKNGIAGLQQINKWIANNAQTIINSLLPAIEKILPLFNQVKNVAMTVFGGIASFFNSGEIENGIGKAFDAIQKFFINIEFALKNWPQVWGLAWEKILLNTEQAMRNVIAVIITPFKLVATNIIEIFGLAFKAVSEAAKDIPKRIKLEAQRAIAVTSKEVHRINVALKNLEQKRQQTGRDLLSNFNFIGFEEAFTKSAAMVDKMFGGSLDKEFQNLAQRTAALNKKLMDFQKMRIQGNKKEMEGILNDIRNMFDNLNRWGGNFWDDIGKGGKQVEEAMNGIKQSFEEQFPTLAKKGSQAAAMGELGMLRTEKEALKVAKEGNNILRRIEQNQNRNAMAMDVVDFGI